MNARRTVLTRAFELLYGPLVLLHEPAGRLAFGPSWPGRRVALLHEMGQRDRILDVGAGSGHLVEAGSARGFDIAGVDPSPAMRRRAAMRGVTVVAGTAQELPFPDGSFSGLVSTYPGPWIASPATWTEFRRVLIPGGTITILFGGTVERGTGARIRRRVLSMLYGDEPETPAKLPVPAGITGGFEVVEDEWGRATIWRGLRA